MDQSAKMLSRARARFDQSGLDAQFLEGDALSPLPFEFDVVVAPFFLNVFSQAELGRAFSLLCAHLRTGGSFISVDFRASTGGLFGALQRLHYLPPVLLFALLTSNPMHGPYDYVAVGEQAAPRLRLEARTITPAWGLPLYETLRWEKR
jgi:ubiquinone/menaquinone biosynthesis C-methylase UbiE